VVDLRGRVTTILNPKVTIGKPETDASGLIVVFDSDAFDDPPVEGDHINGVIDREDRDDFLVWTTPDLAFAGAE
jgi:purine-binding chemotaxis protein CheW